MENKHSMFCFLYLRRILFHYQEIIQFGYISEVHTVLFCRMVSMYFNLHSNSIQDIQTAQTWKIFPEEVLDTPILTLLVNFQAYFSAWWLRCLLSNCNHKNVTELTDDKSTVVQVMAWWRQLNKPLPDQMFHCYPSSMSPYGITRPQENNNIEVT